MCSTFLVPSLLLTYLLLNSCDGNNAFWRHSVLVKSSSSLTAGNTGIYLSRSVSANSPVDYRICGLMQERVYIVQTPVCYSVTPAAVTGDLKQPLIDTWASISKNVIYKAVGQWKKRLRASMKAKWHLFEHLLNWNQLFSEPPTVYPGKHVVSRHFRRSYLKAN